MKIAKQTVWTLILISIFGCGGVNFSSGEQPAVSATGGPIGDGGGGTITAPACTVGSSNTPVLTSLPQGVTQSMIASICPAVGADTQCGAVIIITNNGVSIYYTGQGPYDGDDDTIVGVLNLSSVPISDIALNSDTDIMGFDGDGIDGYKADGITGNSQDVSNSPAFCQSLGGNANSPTECGYGGPNAYFTNMPSGCPEIDESQSYNGQCSSGTVNFIVPVVPNGGSTFFSLENALSGASACISTLIN